MRSRVSFSKVCALLIAMVLIGSTVTASAEEHDAVRLGDHMFATPVFGLANGPGGNGVLVADAGAGIVKLNREAGRLIAELPGVADVATKGRYNLLAVAATPPENETDPPGAAHLFRIDRRTDRIVPLANLTRFERRKNPDGGEIDSNPFDLASRRHLTYVADAGGNSIVVVNTKTRRMNWVATLPTQLASTDFIKDLIGCPDPELPPEEAEICDLPPMIPAQGVPTAVELGPDGAFYVSELLGFPATPGMSRVWRIERGARHAECGTDDRCSVVLEGFTSIIDLDFDRQGRLLVAEMDENGWLAAENDLGIGGTVNRCHLATGACRELGTELPMLTSVLARNRGRVLASVYSLIPGMADVIRVN